MIRHRLSLIVLCLVLLGTATDRSLAQERTDLPVGSSYSFPPEWAPHEVVWFGWSDDPDHHPVQTAMMNAVAPHVPVTVMVASDSARAHAVEMLREAGVPLDRLSFVEHEFNTMWIRDSGPRFLVGANGLAIADFAWNAYGYPNEVRASFDAATLKRGAIDDDVAADMDVPLVTTDLVAEGGALDVSSDVILAYKETAIQRNPGVPLEEIEKEYLRLYGKKKIVWLGRSPLADRVFSGPKIENYFGWGANGHIDEYARFVNDSTVVIAQIDSLEKDGDPLTRVDYEILRENLAELRAATDARGRPFRIVTLPTPALKHHMWSGPLPAWAKEQDELDAWYRGYDVGDDIHWVPAVSYLNFFVTNGVVLVPKYWREGLPESERAKDDSVRETIQRLFPDREVVQINPLAINWGGGGMHCITQQQPLVN